MRGRRSVGALDLVGCMMRMRARPITPPCGRNFAHRSSPHGRRALRRGRLRARDSRDRPGHDGQHLPRLRPRGAARRARLPRVRAALPAARAGSSTTRARSGRRRGPWRCEALADAGRPGRRPERDRHHEPARDRLRVGPGDRRAAAPRDRLAGPAHGRPLRRAARRRARAARPRAHRARPRPLLLGDEDRVAAARGRRPRRARARRARRLRHDRHLADLEPHAASTSTDPSNASRTMLYDLATRRLVDDLLRAVRRPRARAARGPALDGRARHDHGRRAARPRRRARRRRRRRPAGRAVRAGLPGPRAWGRTPTGRASFVLVNTGDAAPAVPPGPARDGRLGHRRARASTRWRRRSSSPARRSSGCATGSASIGDARESEALAGLAGRQRRRLLRARADRAGLAALGSVRPRRRSSASRAARGRAHLARAALEAIAYQTVDAVRAVEAATREPDRGAQGRRRRDRERLAHAVPGRRPRRPGRRARGRGDDGARRRADGRASARASSRRPTSTDLWREDARYEPRMGEDERATLLHGWSRALERSRGMGRGMSGAAGRLGRPSSGR